MAKASQNQADDFESAGASFENNDEGLMVDLEGVQALSFDPLPKGTYNAIIEECEYKLSKSSGKPMWNLRLAVVDEGEFENRKIFTFLSFSEKALPGTKSAIAVIAPELASAKFNPKDPDTIALIVTKKVKVRLDIQKGENGNNDSNRIKKWMLPGDESGFEV